MPKRTVKGDGKKQPFNMRTTAALRKKIETAAGKSGRSLVQEVEYRVEMSFHHEERWTQYREIRDYTNDVERRLAELRDELASIATVLQVFMRNPQAPLATAPDERAIIDKVARNGGGHHG